VALLNVEETIFFYHETANPFLFPCNAQARSRGSARCRARPAVRAFISPARARRAAVRVGAAITRRPRVRPCAHRVARASTRRPRVPLLASAALRARTASWRPRWWGMTLKPTVSFLLWQYSTVLEFLDHCLGYTTIKRGRFRFLFYIFGIASSNIFF
jgi:hypothetical protein